MKKSNLSLFFALLALLLLFFKLPGPSPLLNFLDCKSCSAPDPYLPLIGSFFFALLVAGTLIYPSFPNRPVAQSGLIFSILVAIGFTYLNYPKYCPLCLLAHGSHILMWTFWIISPKRKIPAPTPHRLNFLILFLAPLAVVAFYNSLNLSFLAFGFNQKPFFSKIVSVGERVSFADSVEGKGFVINFVAPDCPYCKEELALVNVAKESVLHYKFINVTPLLTEELSHLSPHIEWREDKSGDLRKLFRVSIYPSLIVVGKDGEVTSVMQGFTDNFQNELMSHLL